VSSPLADFTVATKVRFGGQHRSILRSWPRSAKGRQSQMLHHAHFYMKGGLPTFAASANHPSHGVGSRHSGHPKLGLALRCRKSASSPLYLFSVSQRMSGIGGACKRSTEISVQTGYAMRWQYNPHSGQCCCTLHFQKSALILLKHFTCRLKPRP
jgi:hypothetical protein